MDKEHLNIHDPHEQYTWAEDKLPRWVAVLKVLGFICGAVGTLAMFYFFTGVMLQLEG